MQHTHMNKLNQTVYPLEAGTCGLGDEKDKMYLDLAPCPGVGGAKVCGGLNVLRNFPLIQGVTIHMYIVLRKV